MRYPTRLRRPYRTGPAGRTIMLSAAIAALALTASCAGGSQGPSGAATASAAAAGPGGTVTVRSIDDVDTFNPATTAAPNMSVQAIELTYDRLLYLSPAGKLEPYLATSWKTTPAGAVLTIRKGVTCADGTPMTPSVIADSLRYAFSPSTHGPYTSYVTGSAGAKSVTADNAAGTVTITLKAPYNALLTALATPYVGSIICHAGVTHPASLNAAPDGSGPYVLDKSRSVRGSSYVFTLRKNYNWGPGGWTATTAGVPTTIVDRVVSDDTTGANLLTTGQVDIAPIFGINEQRIAANHSAYTFTTQALQLGSWGVVFNQNTPRPGADPKVRHAVFLALQGSAMVKAAFSTLGIQFSTLATPNMQCYNKNVGRLTPGFDPAQAKAILQQDGYRPGPGGVMTKDGHPLKLKIVMWNTTGQAGDYMQQALQDIGVQSTVQITDIDTWITALFTTKNYDLTVYSYYSGLPNPVIFPSQDSAMSIHDPAYYSLSAKAEAAAGTAQCPAWDKALEHAEAAYDVKPIGVSRNVWFAKGWKFAAPFDVIIDPFTLQRTA
jgi:peptide/nickel transport system substrate-binding protein